VKYIVELQPGCWIAPWQGDPGRTLVERSARRYVSVESAQRALKKARFYSPFVNAKLVEVPE
jgi:hypothetical protein